MIKKGVKQSYVVLPFLFNLYGEEMLANIEDIRRIKVGGGMINNIRYADDTNLKAESEELQKLIDKTVKANMKYCMNLNTKKAKVMVVKKELAERVRAKIYVDGKKLEVDSSKFLGTTLTWN